MKLLITGATGFIGGSLVRHFQQVPGMELVFTGRNQKKGQALAASGGRFEAGDLNQTEFIRQLCEGVSAVIHTAGYSAKWGPYRDFYLANVLATRHLIDACQAQGVRHLINLSSPSMYFNFQDRLDLKEDDLPAKFCDAYAATKYEAEGWVRKAHDSQGLSTLSLRPRCVVGAEDPLFFPSLVSAHQRGVLRKVGKGTNLADFTHIDNLISAIECCFDAPASAWGQVYNITDGQPMPMWEMVNFLLQETGLQPVRKSVPFPLAFAVATVHETLAKIRRSPHPPAIMRIGVGVMAKSMTLNIDRARHFLGYAPRQQSLQAARDFATAWRRQQHHPSAAWEVTA